ncbi:hypothetical protein GGR54DRAFT_639607 [Hypoxylon sp. NC1633]|nr:hypothetical protein GGR54DRAFT_639607 [Hypoxylon sp. NC1633]
MRLTLPLLLGSILVPGTFAATCYTLDQEEAEDWIPCDTSADGVSSHSACCSPNDVCMASGLCLSTRNPDPRGLLWVDACTDRSFKNEACPSTCIDTNNMPMNMTFINLIPCGTNKWCCDIGSQLKVDLSQGVGTVIRQLPSVTGAVSVSTSSGTTSSTISSTSPSSTDSMSPSPPANSSGNSNAGYIAGIAVTSTGFAISLAAFLVTFRRFRRLEQRSQVQQLNFADHGAGMPNKERQEGSDFYKGPGRQYHEVETRETPIELS